MKKFGILLTTLIFLSIAPLSVYAGCTGNSCSDVYIDKLYVSNDTLGSIFIGTRGDETLLNCQAHGDVYTTLISDKPNADKIYSTLLSAQIANKKVRIRVHEDSTGCRIAYVTLERQ